MLFDSRKYFLTCLLLVSLSACGPAPAMLGDSSMFDPDWIIEVKVELDADDWEELRNQTRDIFDVFCSTEPPPNPYTYFEADITVDGIEMDSIGIRKKGFFGSVEPGRPSFKVSFNEYVRGQKFFGMRRMTLNNSRSDPAKIKQCIGYWLFDKAGVPSPRCNFAHVTVNGEDLGLYVHLESIKTELLSRYFDDLSGNLYEGALADFQPNWVGTFQKKTNQEYPDRSDLDAMVTACQTPDDEFLDEIEKLVDLEAFYSFWAMEVLIDHVDGYASFNHNNYYIYNDPQTGRFNFIPWGIDGILFDRPDQPDGTPPIRSVFADSVIANRLYNLPESRAIYLERVKSLLETVWDEQEIIAEIDRMQELITPIADSYQTGELGRLIDEIRQFVRTYPAMILAEIDAGPVVKGRELADPPCFRELGTFEGGFTTTWGTLGVADPFVAGSGTFNALFEGEQVITSQIGAVAGWDPEAPPQAPKALIQVIATVPGQPNDTLAAVMIVINDPSLIRPNAVIPLDMGKALGMFITVDTEVPGSEVFSLLMNGDLVLQEAETAAGARITGTIEAKIFESGW